MAHCFPELKADEPVHYEDAEPVQALCNSRKDQVNLLFLFLFAVVDQSNAARQDLHQADDQ